MFNICDSIITNCISGMIVAQNAHKEATVGYTITSLIFAQTTHYAVQARYNPGANWEDRVLWNSL